MDNKQFTDYINAKLKAITKKAKEERPQGWEQQKKMLEDALRIMQYGTGTARRRFRRDYERNLARQGVKLED